MHTFSTEIRVDQPVEEVFAWHARPGALRRLLPPWEPVTLVEEAPDLREGSEVVLRLTGPSTVSPRWVARHTDYQPPHAFTDVQVVGPFAHWTHRHLFERAPDGGTVLRDRVSYRLPLGGLGDVARPLVQARLRRMFAYRHRQLADDLAAHARAGTRPLTFAVTGSSGMIGRALTAFLTSGGHRVVRLVRRPPRVVDESRWDPSDGSIDLSVLRDVDVVVNLAGAPIGGRWTERRKASMRSSRVEGTSLLARSLARLRADGVGPRVLVNGSAIGYYGAARGGEWLDERAGSGTDFLAELCRDWEAATGPAQEAGVRVVHVRTGVVQSPTGGQLRLQLPLFRAGLGGRLGAGDHWLSWISLDDIVGIYHHVATRDEVHGPVNGVAPSPVTNSVYTRTLGRVLRRPTPLPVPSFGPQLLLGEEGARDMAMASQRVHSAVLAGSGYRFRQPDLDGCLRHVLGR